MTTTLNASTAGAGGFIATSDNSGVLALQTAGTTAITVDTSANVGIGTTSPATKLTVATASGNTGVSLIQTNGSTRNWFIGCQYNVNNSFEITPSTALGGTTFTTPALVVDSSGNVLVGKTSFSGLSGTGAFVASDGRINVVNAASTNVYSTYELYSTGAGAYRFYVGAAGTVFATNTTITSLSDVRHKENIRDLDDGLASVMALKPRKFDWKEGKGQDIKNARGFIAQEFETVFPDLIDEWRDPAPEGEEPYKAINANLIPTLVKAIQELKAELDELKAKVNA